MRPSFVALGIASAFVLACTGGEAPPALSRINATEVTPAAALPLGVGQSWTYKVMERKGAGFRIFGLTDQPATEVDLPNITVKVLSVDDAGRYTVEISEPLPHNTVGTRTITLWADGAELFFDEGKGAEPALTIEQPPNAVSTERLPCTAHYLGGIRGACNAHPGGPMQRAPGLNSGLVRQDEDLRGLAQVLVGIGTAGLFIPGNKAATVTMELHHHEPGQAVYPDNTWDLWEAIGRSELPDSTNKRIKLVKQLANDHGSDAESVAAVVYSLSNDEMAEHTPGLLELLPLDQRAAVARVGMQRVDTDFWSLQMLARSADLLPSDDATRRSLESRVPDNAHQVARLLARDNPGLRAAYDRAGRPGKFDEAAIQAIAEHPLNEETVRGYLDGCKLGHQRDVIDAILTAAPEPDRPTYLAISLSALGQDTDAMVEVIGAHADAARAMPSETKASIVENLAFDDGKAAVARALGM